MSRAQARWNNGHRRLDCQLGEEEEEEELLHGQDNSRLPLPFFHDCFTMPVKWKLAQVEQVVPTPTLFISSPSLSDRFLGKR